MPLQRAATTESRFSHTRGRTLWLPDLFLEEVVPQCSPRLGQGYFGGDHNDEQRRQQWKIPPDVCVYSGSMVIPSNSALTPSRARRPHPTEPTTQVVKAGTHASAQAFDEGTVVGIGWHGNHCHSCEACADGDFMCCERQQVTGLHFGGGYQQ